MKKIKMVTTQTTIPKVTVIIPCYNRKAYIQDTIESVISQTYPRIDIICVDDGCTDGTREILESYGSKIKILEHKNRENKGQSAAINLGIRNSESEYVSILDSDDLFAQKKIEEQVHYLENYRELGYMYSNGYVIDQESHRLYRIFSDQFKAPSDPETVLLHCPLGTPTGYLIRRITLSKTGLFNENYRSSQDHDMAIRLAEVSRVGYVNKIHWFKREHSDSLSQQQAERRWMTGLCILKEASKRYPYSFSVRRRRLAILHFRLGQCRLDKKKLLKAIYHFSFAGILDPYRALYVLAGKEKITSAK